MRSSLVPKIADFGLAKVLDADSDHTASGAILGTPSYMAPEQAGGQARRLGPACDVYSLGAILYETLTGRPPFKGATTLETLEQVRGREPVPPSQLQPKLPADLETICLKCLDKEPHRRYASARDLADDLHRFLVHEPIVARPIGRLERSVKWMRRRPLLAALLGVSLLTLLSLTGASAGLWHTLQLRDAALEVAHTEKTRARAEQLKAQRSETQTRQYLCAADLRLAHQFWKNGEVQPMRALLDRHRDDGAEPREFAWHYFNRLAQSSEADTLRGHAGAVTSAAFSGDGRTLATGGADGSIRLWNAVDRQARGTLSGHAGGVTWLAFLADGLTLASAGSDKTVRLWDVVAGNERGSFARPQDAIVCLAVSPDGKLAAAGLSDHSIKVWDLTSKKQRLHLGRQSASIEALAFAPDRPFLASAGRDRAVRLWDLSTGQYAKVLSFDTEATAVAFSPNGWFVAAGLQTGRVHVSSLARIALGAVYGDAEHAYRPHTGPVRALAFSPDSQVLASGSDDATVQLYEVRARTVRDRFRGHTDGVAALTFAPEGQTLASASRDGTIKLWRPGEAQDRRALATPLHPAGPVAVAPDGKTIAVASKDGSIHLIDQATGRTTSRLVGHRGPVWAAAFDPRGGRLATAGLDLSVKVWEVAKSQPVLTLPVPDLPLAVAFSPGGQLLAAGLNNGLVPCWDAATGAERTVLRGHGSVVHALAFSADGQVLASGGDDRTVRLWDVAASKEASRLTLESPIGALAFAHQGRRLATVEPSANRVQLWDSAAGKALANWRPLSQVGPVAFAPDDQTLAAVEGDAVHMLDAAKLETRLFIEHGHVGPVRGVALTPDGRTLVSVDGERVQLWDLEASRLRRPLGQSPGPVQALAFTPDGHTLVTGGGAPLTEILRIVGQLGNNRVHVSRPDEVRCWDVATGQERPRLPEQRSLRVEALALLPQGPTVLAGSRGGALWRWDLNTGRQLNTRFVRPEAEQYWELMEVGRKLWPTRPIYGDTVRSIAVSPDGRFFATASDGGLVALWDAANGQVRVRLSLKHADVRCVAFSPDGETLAANDGAAVQLWDLAGAEPQPLRRLEGHKEPILCLAFSPDGKWLATGARDRHLILWDRSGTGPRVLIGHAEAVAALAFSPDSQTLASGGWDGLVRLWHVGTAQELAGMEGHTGRVQAVAFAPGGQTLASGGEAANGAGEVFLWQTAVQP